VSGKEQAIRITPSTGLNKEEIDRMILEAKQYADSDRKLKETTELRNRVKGQLSSLLRSYAELGWILDTSEQQAIKVTIQKARDLPPGEENLQHLRELLAELESGASKLAAAMMGAPIRSRTEKGALGTEDLQRLVQSALDDTSSKEP